MRRLCPWGPLPVHRWPERDQAAWAAGHGPGDVFEDAGPARHWRPATSCWAAVGYGGWLGWLAHHGLLDPAEPPVDRCTRERVARYHQEMLGLVAPATAATRLIGLERALSVLQPRDVPDWLRAARRRVSTRPTVSRRPRLRLADELLGFAVDLMDKADSLAGRPKDRARLYRNGLIIAFLTCRPLRRRNLAGLELGRTLVRLGDGWEARFGPEETKSHCHLRQALPRVLAERLEIYLARHRPNLCLRGETVCPETGPLWISGKTGAAMSGHTMNLTIGALIRERFGQSMWLHLFRETPPTTLAVHEPADVRAAAAVLGHADYRTTERWYNMATTMDAARSYAEALEALRPRKRRR